MDQQTLRQRRRWIAFFAIAVLLLVLARLVPAVLRSRSVAKDRTCIANLQLIDQATLSWQIDNKATDTASPGWEKIFNPALFEPTCPKGGSYTVGTCLTPPTCSHPGHAITINTNFTKEGPRYEPAASRF